MIYLFEQFGENHLDRRWSFIILPSIQLVQQGGMFVVYLTMKAQIKCHG